MMAYVGREGSDVYGSDDATGIEHGSGPDRVYDADAADPAWKPHRVGFAPPPRVVEPLLWEGDNA